MKNLLILGMCQGSPGYPGFDLHAHLTSLLDENLHLTSLLNENLYATHALLASDWRIAIDAPQKTLGRGSSRDYYPCWFISQRLTCFFAHIISFCRNYLHTGILNRTQLLHFTLSIPQFLSCPWGTWPLPPPHGLFDLFGQCVAKGLSIFRCPAVQHQKSKGCPFDLSKIMKSWN